LKREKKKGERVVKGREKNKNNKGAPCDKHRNPPCLLKEIHNFKAKPYLGSNA
jgi:hypothetical protein